MMRKSTLFFVVLTFAFSTATLWAGEGKGVLKRTQARLQQKSQYSKAILHSAATATSQAPVDFYQGPRLYKSGAVTTVQVDDATSNTLVWGIYGPGRNLVRDPETGALTAAWARTPTTGTKLRTIFAANSMDAGATWTVNGPLDEASSSRGYYSDVFRAGSNDAGGITDWIVWSERDSKRLDIIQDLVPGLLIFDAPRPLITASNIPAPDPTLDMVFTHAASAPNGDGTWSIYATEYATAHATEKDNILFVKSTDSGTTWSTPTFIFGDAAGQVSRLYQVAQTGSLQGNYCALAMAVDPNDSKHIGGVFISNNIADYDANSADSLLHPFGIDNSDYQYYFIESNDGGDTWSTPEMLLGRDPIARQQWEFTVGQDTTGDGSFDVSNKAYLYGGAFFWAFLYQPIYTADGSFHVAFMPTLAEVVPAGGLAVGIGSNYNVPCYGRRDPSGQWTFKTDFVGTTLGFDSTATEMDPRFGQAWFAEMSKSADGEVIGISWSSRLPAYTPAPGHGGYPKKGCFVVAASPDNGQNWTEAKAFFVDGGLPEGIPGTGAAAEGGAWPGSSVSSILVQDVDNPNVYRFEFLYQACGADNVTIFRESQGIWYTNEPSVDITTVGVKNRPAGAPTTYNLGQNYPNPFNPSTTIDYSLSSAGQVKLSIINALGQVVATLVNGRVAAGQHTTVWDAKNVPSGVYFYKLEAENFSQTKKMVLMK